MSNEKGPTENPAGPSKTRRIAAPGFYLFKYCELQNPVLPE